MAREGEIMLDNVAQLALDVSIMEGTMDQRLKGIAAYMSVSGSEMETFNSNGEIIDALTSDRNGNDFASSGRQILHEHFNVSPMRLIGALLIVANTLVLVSLNQVARRRRHLKGVAGIHTNGANGLGGLGHGCAVAGATLSTYSGVNVMLDMGRKNSLETWRESQELTVREGSSSSSADMWAVEETRAATVRKIDPDGKNQNRTSQREVAPSSAPTTGSSPINKRNKPPEIRHATKSACKEKTEATVKTKMIGSEHKIKVTTNGGGRGKHVPAASSTIDTFERPRSSGSLNVKKRMTKTRGEASLDHTVKQNSKITGRSNPICKHEPKSSCADEISVKELLNKKEYSTYTTVMEPQRAKPTTIKSMGNDTSSLHLSAVKSHRRKSTTDIKRKIGDTDVFHLRQANSTKRKEDRWESPAKREELVLTMPPRRSKSGKTTSETRLKEGVTRSRRSSQKKRKVKRVDPKLRLGHKPISATRRPS